MGLCIGTDTGPLNLSSSSSSSPSLPVASACVQLHVDTSAVSTEVDMLVAHLTGKDLKAKIKGKGSMPGEITYNHEYCVKLKIMWHFYRT